MIRRIAILAVFLAATATTLSAQFDPSVYREMRWRSIGPFRGGRTVAAAGVVQQPNVFYIGVNNGGVWKTTDYGRVWVPLFDEQPSSSIGAIAVAPSDPNTVYVGSGEGLQRPDLSTGDGMYRSTDAGKTWKHLGLRDAQQIPAIVVDPKDPKRLYVAALGHPYGPNAERGIFRSTDGGETFQKVLFKDENTGGMDVALDPSNPQTVYAVLWEARQGPWENGMFSGPGSGFYKSTDGGTTWKQTTKGLPSFAEGLGRIGIEVCPADPQRLYAIIDAKKGGLYRSDDRGESWQLVSDFPGIWERGGDFNEVRADPKNADVLFVANVVTWKSTDGGKTWHSFRGAPGGDDYHRLWVNPNDPNIIIDASDQGAVITVNGGQTWSSWYNQSTAQFYHVNADNAFPYRVCGGQQESGSACVWSRGDDGRITMREWHPVGIEEYGYAVPDPLDPDIIYGGRIEKYDRRIAQATQVTPKPLRGNGFRTVRTAPVIFSEADPHVLFFGANSLWKTTDGAHSWTEISPDLTRKTWSVPANVGVFTPEVKVTQRGVIYAVAPSPLDVNRIWAGTDDGLIHVTTDGGKNWKDVTPKELTPWSKVSIMEASHHDANEAYAAINTFRLDDLRPHIYRTKDGGTTWQHVTNGIPDGAIINVVREDRVRRGLLFAGSETQVWVSFDDGDHWQSLRQNMPAQSIRDLVIKDDDVIVGTHGRGFWILDDITPLRQLTAESTAADAHLFAPQRAWRWRWNKNTDTPLPPDEPAGENPPDGAILNYALKAPVQSVVLEVTDGGDNVIRRYSSADKVEEPKDSGNIPWYWIRPQRVPSTAAGMHRFVWDLHYPPAPGGRANYPIGATPYDTAPAPTSPWVLPGTYHVRLVVNGKVAGQQTLKVDMDPRVKTPSEGLQQQFTLSKQMYDDIARVWAALGQVRAFRERAKSDKTLEPYAGKAEALEGASGGGFGIAGPPNGLASLNGTLRSALGLLQGADVTPTVENVAAVNSLHATAEDLVGRWETLRKEAKFVAVVKPVEEGDDEGGNED
jgi:photosystem II stability/assembly factor-like uncharacterized protein